MVGTLGPGIGQGRASRFMYVATAGQTTFSGPDNSAVALTMNYTPGYVEVVLNGMWLPPSDYTATNGSSVVFPLGLAAGDIVYCYALSTFSVNTSVLVSPGSLWGLTMSTAGSSTTMTIAAGICADSTNTVMMKLPASLAKTTSAWTLGAGGALDTGASTATTWYSWFVIYNPTTNVTDLLCSLSPTAPTLPAGFVGR